MATNVNTNGFDIDTKGNTPNIIAEVKCNIPVNKHSFGADQIKGIINDLNGLADGKSKSKTKVKDCFKFMVLLKVNAVEESMKKVVDAYNKEGPIPVKEYKKGDKPLSKDCIYVVYIDSDKI